MRSEKIEVTKKVRKTPRHEIRLPSSSPKTGHEEPRVAIERGTPQDCGGTEQAEEYTDYKSVIGQLCFAIICLNSFYIGIYQSKFINCLWTIYKLKLVN
jgi:hypothetical protein